MGESSTISSATTARRWIIDPIDGTKNYVRSVPIWATLIGLEHAASWSSAWCRRPLHMRWWAARGMGRSERRGDPRVVGRGARRRALVRMGHVRIVRARRHRSPVARALHRCWRARIGDFWQHMLVAEGAFDAAIDPIVSLWDVAALIPIVDEAVAAGARSTVADAAGAASSARTASARRRARRAQPVASAHVGDHRRDRHRHVV
jgi:histidinol-phosphatase